MSWQRHRGNGAARIAADIRLAELVRHRDALQESESRLRDVVRRIETMGDSGYLDFALRHRGKTLLDAERIDEGLGVLDDALGIREAKGDAALIASTEAAIERGRTLLGQGGIVRQVRD